MTAKGGSLSGDSRYPLRRGNARHARAKKSRGVASGRKPSGRTCVRAWETKPLLKAAKNYLDVDRCI